MTDLDEEFLLGLDAPADVQKARRLRDRRRAIIVRRLNPITWFWWVAGWFMRDRWKCGEECPHCDYSQFDFYDGPWFHCTNSGSSYIPGEPTCYWFEGVQTCPRCTHTFEVSDSS